MTTNNQQSTRSQQGIRILVVDNNLTDRKDLVQKVEKMEFFPIIAGGLEQDSQGWAKIRGKELIEDAIRKAREARCHAALVDMRLYDDNDTGDKSGLDLVSRLMPAKSVIVTGHGSVPTFQEAQSKGAVLMVGKEQGTVVLQRELRKVLTSLIRMDFTVVPNGWIQRNITPFLKSADDAEVQPEEIRDLLAVLFPDTRRLHLQHVPNYNPASLQGLTGTRRSSVVIKVRCDNLPVSSVVKISTPARISVEKANFEYFVRDRLQGRHYAQLDRTELLWNVGGAVYTLLDDDEQKADISQFRRFYADHDAEAIAESLGHFFEQTWSANIQDQKPLDESLFDCYDSFWVRPEIDKSTTTNKTNGPLRSRFPKWEHKDDSITYNGLEERLPDPRRWIVNNHSESALPTTKKCVVHGDLNGENLFVDSSKKTWAIDFERTGYGHIFTDFVEMEHYILSQLAQVTDASARYALMVAITTPRFLGDEIPEPLIDSKHPGYLIIKKAVEVIRGLRKIAYKLFPQASQLEYYWALYLDDLYGVQRFERLQELGMTVHIELEWELFIGSFLCLRIKGRLEDPWPPKNVNLNSMRPSTPTFKDAAIPSVQLPPRSHLERIIRPNNRFQDIESWTERCREMAARVCRIEITNDTKAVFGTGFLIGPDLIMTNYHVIESLLQPESRSSNNPQLSNVLLRFGYRRLSGGRIDSGQVYRLVSKDWLVDYSAYSEEIGIPLQDHLDYAILRVDGKPGLDRLQDDRQRGWIDIPSETYLFSPGSGLIIIQHPKGEPIKLAVETNSIIGIDPLDIQVTHQTNTEHGSSGSPCFSLEWELVALHHSGDPGWRPTFNAGTPIHTIMNMLRQRNLDRLIGKAD